MLDLITFKEISENLFVSRLSDELLAENQEFYLAIRSIEKENNLTQDIPRLVKVGTLKTIETIINHNMPGLTLDPVLSTAANLPDATFQYFLLETYNNPFWEVVNEEKSIAINVPSDSDILEIRLLVVKSVLPQEMPDQIEIDFSSRGMSGESNCRLFENILFTKSWSAEISLSEQEKLYQTFYENRFDLIKNDRNDKNEVMVTDIIQSISLSCRFKDETHFIQTVHYGGRFALSGVNWQRYYYIVKALNYLVTKHKPMVPSETSANDNSFRSLLKKWFSS